MSDTSMSDNISKLEQLTINMRKTDLFLVLWRFPFPQEVFASRTHTHALLSLSKNCNLHILCQIYYHLDLEIVCLLVF